MFKYLINNFRDRRFAKSQASLFDKEGTLYNSFIQTNTIFIHIPKTAGTSIEKQALNYNIYWGVYYFKNKLNKNYYYSSVPWHIPPKYLTNNEYENKILFCVVRNPYTRIVSEYKYTKNRS